MPTFFPTQIEQVNDYSHIAGKQIIDALRNQAKNNPIQDAQKLLDTFLTNRENRAIAEAVAQYNQGIEEGKTAVEALQGISSYIAGSDEFRQQADKIRESRIRQDAEDRAKQIQAEAVRKQRLQEEADYLNADYQAFTNKLGKDAAPLWFERNRKILQNNPYAYKQIMDTSKANNLSLQGNDGTTEADDLTYSDVINTSNQINRALDATASTGQFSDLVKNAERYKSKESLAKAYIDMAGYKEEDARDFKRNFNDGYEIVKAHADRLGLPTEAALLAIDQTISPSLWSYIPFAGRFAQDVVKTDAAKDFLTRMQHTYPVNKALYTNLQDQAKIINQAKEGNTALQARILLSQQIRRANQAYEQGEINSAERDQLISAANKTYNTTIAPIQNAIDISRDLMQKVQLSK